MNYFDWQCLSLFIYKYIISVSPQAGLLKYRCKIAEHELAGDGEDDDAEELTDDIERRGTQVSRETVGTDEHEIERDDTEGERDAEAGYGVLRRDGEQGGERTRTRVHREGERHNRTAGPDFALELVILENRNIEDHLQRHEEYHKSAGDSEILDLHAEELEYPFAREKERDKNHKTGEAHAPRADTDTLVLHRYRNGYIAERIDDRNHEDIGRENLPNIDRTKEIQYSFHSN